MEVINLSKKKWVWMADKNADSLQVLLDDKAMFVHMGGRLGENHRKLILSKVVAFGTKKAEVYSSSVNIIGNTAIMLDRYRFTSGSW